MSNNLKLYYSTDAYNYSNVEVYATEIWTGEPEDTEIYSCEPLNGSLINISGYRDSIELAIPYGDGFNTGKLSAILAFKNMEYKKIEVIDTTHPGNTNYPVGNSTILSLAKSSGFKAERKSLELKVLRFILKSRDRTE